MGLRSKLAALVAATTLFGGAAQVKAQVTGDPLTVDGGQVSGRWRANAGVRAYLGVPFAAPPVGELRWRPPQPVAPWQGARAAHAYAAQCMQPPRPRDSVYFEYFGQQATSEDCLYLNVWAPAEAPPQGRGWPVMMWIYGGAFQVGSAANPVFDGTELARRGVVVVAANYRVGVFGFLAHPELTAESPQRASGNYGLLDQAAALRWVRRNAVAFGGDPGNVTVFGQSAGAHSVNHLLASPLARGLFHRAAAQSYGFGPRMSALAEGEREGAEFARRLGAPGIAALRARPAQELLETRAAMWPIVDGWMLPEATPAVFAQGRQAPVPLLLGWNADEGTTFPHATTVASHEQMVRRRYGDAADRVLEAYPARDDAGANRASKALFGDATFAWTTWTAARLHARAGHATFLYHFRHPQPLFPGQSYAEIDSPDGLGTFHSSEYPYVFGTLATLTRAWTGADRALSERMGGTWAAFAATGSPNGPGLPEWSRFGDAEESVMHLGDHTGPGPVPGLDRLRFLDGLPVPREVR